MVYLAKLIITEKADAGRRIAYFLSGGKTKSKRSKGLNYTEFGEGKEKVYLIPLSGHIVEADFPPEYKDWKTTDLKLLIDAKIVKNVKNRVPFETLKALSSDVDEIIVATDYDREGELIGAEALDIMNVSKDIVKRAKFSALTGEEIRNAFEKTIAMNYNLADAADARERIDLIWGSVLTRFFSLATGRLGKYFLSVGRVQTPTLALIVEREKEISAFIPQKFWVISVTFSKGKDFEATYVDKLFDEEKARKIFSEIDGKNGTVKKYEKTDEKIWRPRPFSTNDFLREASRIGVLPSRAMAIAESLYMRGYISYPRTDNTVYPRSINLKSVLKKLKGKTPYDSFIDEILSFEHIRPSRGKTETTDHPPVYTVDVPKEELKGDYGKVYDLILRRFLSTLYREGEKTVQKAEIDISGYIFTASGSKITDMGWLSIYGYSGKNEELPELVENEELEGKAWNMSEDQTRPPARYDMASLLKKMEDLNLGTKSTRHEIIAKLADRGFVEGNPVKPTNLGISFIDAVKSQNSMIAEPVMTAELEMDMDRIEKSDMKEEEVVSESRRMLHTILLNFEASKENLRDMIINGANKGEVIGKCPFDGKNLLLVKDRYTNIIRCENEACRINFRINKYGMIQLTDRACPVCGLPMIKIIRRGQSPEIKCINPECSYNKDKNDIGECPSDGGRLVIRQSKYGKRFLGCSNYPDCKVTYPLPQTGTVVPAGEKCQYCGAPILIIRKKGKKWKFCPKIECEYNKRKKNESKS